MEDAIRTDRLTKHYGRRAVVNQLSLRVPTGCVYGLLGRNGAGKSTTLKMLAGMVQPDFGRAELLGEEVRTLSSQRRARIAYLAEGHPLYGWMTIRELTTFAISFYPDADRTFLDRAIDHFALSPRSKIGRLSNGQKAQVSLILALAADPDLLLLDDPTLGLDTNVRRDFLESMVQIIQRRGRTILFSSHVLGDVERVADRVGVMIDGVLRVDCPTEHFKRAVERVIVEFGRQPPTLPMLPGLLYERGQGTRRELVFVGYGASQRLALEALSPLRIEEVELNLEDAFVEYTRSNRATVLFGEELTQANGEQGDEVVDFQGAA
jgi:ABC-2 type transport system ATP-binding protein